jgi:transcriptional regulator with XRE-family HTH domain
MDSPPSPPSEAVLLRRARKARGLTLADAAAEAGVVKASRWGQIENGYVMKDGVPIPTSAKDMQLAHMARVVGLTSQQLAAAGREDAAAILGEIERQGGNKLSPSPPEGMSAGERAAASQLDLLMAAMSEAARRAAREEVAADIAEMRQRIAQLEEQLRKETS